MRVKRGSRALLSMSLHLEFCVQFLAFQNKRGIYWKENNKRTTKTTKGVEHFFSKEGLRVGTVQSGEDSVSILSE